MKVRILIATIGIALVAAGCGGSDDHSDSTAAGKGGAKNEASEVKPGVGPGPVGSGEEQYRSTFALDVDTASYGYARRTIQDGVRPDSTTVRPEEFVNHFRQDYPEPPGNGFSITTDGAKLPADEGDVRMLRVGLQTRRAPSTDRRDANLTFVVDTSGSMAEPGRLDLVRDALHTLVDRLRPSDRVAIVAYESKARMVKRMTPVSQREDLHAAIDSIRLGGSTNLESGMAMGYQEARRAFRGGVTNRVILTSDGLANTGATSSEPILRRVADERAKGISLLCVGVGSNYGDKLMEQLADRGDGMAVYVSEREQARKLFAERLPDTLELRSRDAKAQVSFDPRAVESYRLIGYDDRLLKSRDFRNDAVDGGEIGPGHSVTALYAVRLQPQAIPHIGQVAVRWQDPDTRRPQEDSRTITESDLSPRLAAAPSARLRVAAVAAYFAEQLRDGQSGAMDDQSRTSDDAFVTRGRLPGEPATTLTSLAKQADQLAAKTEDRDVSELARLIHQAAEI